MKRSSVITAAVGIGVGTVLGALGACGSSGGASHGGGGDEGGVGQDGGPPVNLEGDGGGIGAIGDGSGGSCSGLQCQIHSCPNVTTGTTVTGHVYDPAGTNVLYNVVVYVPNTTPSALPAAPTNECGACNSLYTGNPIAAAITDAKGSFTMNNVPDGANIPLVVQIGKWRTQLVVPQITACAPNNLDTLLSTKITLPGVAGISTIAGPTKGLQQDIPQIAISTGGADSLECLLRRIGVAASEYTPGAGGTGHIHIFKGTGEQGGTPSAGMSGGTTPSAMGHLWDTGSDLSPYDILILSCEGQETTGSTGVDAGLTSTELSGLQSFTNAGGRAFLSHFHYSWLNRGPFAAANPPLAAWTPGSNPIEDNGNAEPDTILGDIVETLYDGGVFTKGSAFFTWLGETDSLQGNQLPIEEAKDNALVSPADVPSQPWITADKDAILVDPVTGKPTTTSAAGATEYFTFDTPLGGAGVDDAGAPIYCGRIVYSDLHVGAASGDYDNGLDPQPTVPSGCADNPLSPQEKALEFMLFDLSSCVTPDTGGGGGAPPIQAPK